MVILQIFVDHEFRYSSIHRHSAKLCRIAYERVDETCRHTQNHPLAQKNPQEFRVLGLHEARHQLTIQRGYPQ